MTETNEGKRFYIINYVQEYFLTHPEKRVTADELANYCSAQAGRSVTTHKVAGSVGFAIAKSTDPDVASRGGWARNLEIVVHRRSWVYHPGGVKTAVNLITGVKLGSLFEYVATTKNGTILVESEDGKLFKLTEID